METDQSKYSALIDGPFGVLLPFNSTSVGKKVMMTIKLVVQRLGKASDSVQIEHIGPD